MCRQREWRATELYPEEVIWMSKGQAAKALSGLANPPRVRRPQAPLKQKDPPPSPPRQLQGGNCSQTQLWTQRHTHSTHEAPSDPLGHMEKASFLPNSQASEPVPRAGLLAPSSWTQGLPGQGSPRCPSTLQGSSRCCYPTLLLPGHLGWCTLRYLKFSAARCQNGCTHTCPL